MKAGTATSYHPKLSIVSDVLINVRQPDIKQHRMSQVKRQGSNTKFKMSLQQLWSLRSTTTSSSIPRKSSGICEWWDELPLPPHPFTPPISTRSVAITFFWRLNHDARAEIAVKRLHCAFTPIQIQYGAPETKSGESSRADTFPTTFCKTTNTS